MQDTKELERALSDALLAERENRQSDALASFHRALSIDSNHPGALLRVAQSNLRAGSRELALEQLRTAASSARARGLGSQSLTIYTEMIIALRAADVETRLSAVRSALAECGEVPGLIWEECECLRALNMRPERVQRLNRLAALQPKDPVILTELGRALLGSNSAAQAVIPLRAAYELGARDTAFLVSLANAEITGGSLARAEALLDQALLRAPDDFAALAFRCNVAQRSCDFEAVRRFEPLLAEAVRARVSGGDIDVRVAPFLLLATELDSATLRDYSARYYQDRIAQQALESASRARAKHARRIRVGYLAGDFHGHAVSILTAGMFERADRAQFENFALSYGPRVDNEYQRRLKAAFEHWFELNDLNDRDAAESIRALDLDVLVDLKGCTSGSRPRIVAHRPAPIQMHFLAYPCTMGLPGIDYYVADEITIPIGQEHEFSEHVIRLPGCFFPNDDQREHPSPPTRGDLGLPADAFVLCNFNQTWKLRERYVRAWFAALAKHRHAVLWLGDPGADHPSRKNLLALAQTYGVHEQLIWANYPTLTEHLARVAQADLAVDQSPYNSHTTAADALWMGVPVLTCRGDRFDSRVAASLLAAAGATEWITENIDEYEAKLDKTLATAAAAPRPRERNTHLYTNTVLFDTAQFTRNWEAMIADVVAQRNVTP